MSEGRTLLITCEHGGNRIPKRYRSLFAGQEALLSSHRGWDPGALSLAQTLARSFHAPLHHSRTSRLLVDLNRSLHHPDLFSSITRKLPSEEREEILRRYYRPYRDRVTSLIEGWIESGATILHLAIHTFTPVLNGEVRRVEVGLLYDPGRREERALCHGVRARLRGGLAKGAGAARVRLNQPYRGKADGFPTWLRKRCPPSRYLGIELEVNQGLILGEGWERRGVKDAILEAFREPPRQ
ncbi:MAG: N-formylglutamate amidohydrolase [Longimicrobiales bacterium]|nr:N-formylglutamate amidohydrolase [Longimicrobiales bacterium]